MITREGQPCKHCGTPVVRREHEKPPKYRPGRYFFEWWFLCPNRNCKAIYMVEDAKRWFDGPKIQNRTYQRDTSVRDTMEHVERDDYYESR
jgi:hypothetical protein